MSEKRIRMKPEARRDQILSCAVELALLNGFNSLTRDSVAEAAGAANGLVSHYFSTMDKLRHAVMRAAVARELKPIIATGLAQGDSIAFGAPDWLKRESLDMLME